MLRLGDPESAIGVLKQGLANHPESAELHELHGDALVQRNFRRAAESCYQKAVEIEPQRAGAWRALGSVRLELGYEKSALEPLRRAVELGLDDAPTWLLVARAARGAGETCAAFDAYERAFERTTADTATLLEASTLCLESIVCRTRPDAVAVCRSWLERATAINPQSIEAHFQLGVLAEVDDRDDAAIEHYLRAVEIDPAYLPALRNLALIYAQRRDVENTRKTVERALELERDPDRRKALEKLLEPASGAVALPIKATARR
jgi:tetratricopeptide (TPR) repeat protein